MSRHAYLIMAHSHFNQLQTLLRCLDDERNDIYLHLDAKLGMVDSLQFEKEVNRAGLYILFNRVNVRWGDFSQIECELRLLEAAIPRHYAYYHLMSGMDLPLCPQDTIHRYFDEKQGTEFVHFDASSLDKYTYERVSKYAFFAGRNKTYFDKVMYRLITASQFWVDRGRMYGIRYQKGANWFSITDAFAYYVVSRRKMIEKIFKKTRCGDEFFLQTLLVNSDHRYNLYIPNFDNNYDSIRYVIDWERGNPYVFRSEDYCILMSSGMLFARKFDSDIDSEIIKMIELSVTSGN